MSIKETYHRKVIIEKMIKLSFFIEREQKNYKCIDIFKEYASLVFRDAPAGHYKDPKFLEQLKKYEL